MEPKTTIAILNYNGQQLLASYLPSIIEFCPDNTSVCIIDNCSTDDSCLFIESNYPDIRLIRLDKNYGYAGGYNEGLRFVKSEYLVLLNSDITVDQDWLTPIIGYMDERPEIGVCQPKIKSLKEPEKFEYAGAAGGWIDRWGYPFCKGRIFDHIETDHNQYNDPGPIFWASGAAFVVRREIFHQLEGFDHDFFAHMEEIDLCWRIQRYGYEIHTFPQTHVFHLGGGTLSYQNTRKTYLNFRNNLYLLTKNQEKKNFIITIFTRLILDGLSGIKFLFDRKPAFIFSILKAHLSYYRNIPDLLRKRKQMNKRFKATAKIYGRYKGSIVYAYFIQKIKKFGELNTNCLK